MKTVSAKKYDIAYFKRDHTSKYSHGLVDEEFTFIHLYLLQLLKHSSRHTIVDFGCGDGDLCFLLASRCASKIIGIDYSKDAIALAKQYQNLLIKNQGARYKRILFLNRNNNHLPHLTQVTHIYLIDVVEHLYDEELVRIFNTFKTWGKNIKVVIHTDNNLYLMCILPIMQFIKIVTFQYSLKEIIRQERYMRERHVNLMTPAVLAKKLQSFGYHIVHFEYTPITYKKVQAQLGSSLPFLLLTPVVYACAKLFPFLLPGFYMIVEANPSGN